MKKFNPAKLLFGFLGIATFLSLAGTVSGTLAWYAYSTRALLSYTGTSVEKTAQLQIGVVSPNPVAFAASDKMTEDTDLYDGVNHYYFAPVGSGLNSAALNRYLAANEFATNYLIPVTSGTYSRGDAFSLKKAPDIASGNIYNNVVATKDHYAYFQFIFRIAKTSVGYVDDQELWLTDAEARASYVNGGNVSNAVRVYIDRGADYEDDFIFNPTSTVLDTERITKVGGILDLDGDGYYDYNASGEEYLYGQFDNDVGLSGAGYDGADEIDDVNGSLSATPDTFTAKHAQGIKYYSDLSGCGVKTASYESISSIAPKTSNGKLENFDENHPTSICKTNGSDNHLARVNMYVYLEGWDYSVIDEEIDHMFDLGLTFEINKVNENE